MDWIADASCRGIHPDFLFAPLEAPDPGVYYAIGKYVCAGCPVWRDCLAYGTSNDETWGIWGGLTPQERKRPQTLRHGSMESFRFGCRCVECLDYPEVEPVNTGVIPRSGEEYDLQTLIIDITRG